MATHMCSLLRRSTNSMQILPHPKLFARACKSISAQGTQTAQVGNLKYEVKPERLKAIEDSPSGWVPPLDPPPDLPFHVARSRYGAFPVYVDHDGGSGNRNLTIIRKVRGDIKELEKCIKYKLGDDVECRVNEITSQLKIKGNYPNQVRRWLKELGF